MHLHKMEVNKQEKENRSLHDTKVIRNHYTVSDYYDFLFERHVSDSNRRNMQQSSKPKYTTSMILFPRS